ncbi:putative F-box protein [Raphanus sativus]|nr:putative F-box protein [Raphanus sativus]
MRRTFFERVAFLPFDGRDFTLVAGVLDTLMMYRSREERWIKIECPFRSYQDMVSFKGKFYVVDKSGRGRVFVIEPSLEVSEIPSVTQSHECYWERLVVSGDDELLLVQRFTPGEDHMHTWFRIFRLEEKEGQRRWVRVTDLEERVVFLGINWNFCYSAKEVPGMKGNCVMFIQSIISDGILVFDLGTRKTTQSSTVCRGMGMLCENKESISFCDASS